MNELSIKSWSYFTPEEIAMINESLDSADKREYGSRLVKIKLRLKELISQIEDRGGFEMINGVFKINANSKKLGVEYETLKAEEKRIISILHEK